MKKIDNLQKIVGKKIYSVWTDMLHITVPNGRTHRLAPLIATMLTYAVNLTYKTVNIEEEPKEKDLAWSLIEIEEGCESNQSIKTVLKAVEQLFKDAKVNFRRRNSKGQVYSIAKAAIDEFMNWDTMPWEHYNRTAS